MSGYPPWESRHEANVSGDQVAAYEHWVDTVLLPKLESHRRKIAKVMEEMGEYAELKEKLLNIMAREDQGPLEMLAELGADCYTRVKVDDPSKVFVHVALGFHVEFTLPEAISFVGVKRSSLATNISKLKEQESELARDVVSAEAMIQELRELSTCAAR